MRVVMAGFAILLTSAIYVAAIQFRASVHPSIGSVDANGNGATALHA
jgi:hypothetical protein